MRAVGVLLVLGWSLLGCPRSSNVRPDASATIPLAAPRATQHGCSLEEAHYVATPEGLESPWLSAGPNGPRVIGRAARGQRLSWRDAHAPMVDRDAGDVAVEGSLPSALSLWPQALGWTGRGYVGAADERVTFVDARFLSPRPVRRLSLDGAMALPTALRERETIVGAASREGAVLLGWIREEYVGHGGGTPWVALVGADGELLMDPRPLSVPGPQSDVSEQLRSMEVRWDFGRFVVQGYLGRDSTLWSWVLEPDGRNTWAGPGKVVCLLSGCVRAELTPATDRQLEGQFNAPSQVLQLAPIVGSAASIDTSIDTNDVQAVAVSGDRLLVLHAPIAGGGCTVHVYDVRHRAIIHESSSAQRCAAGNVLATPAGFSLLEVDPSNPALGVAVRALSCGDDT